MLGIRFVERSFVQIVIIARAKANGGIEFINEEPEIEKYIHQLECQIESEEGALQEAQTPKGELEAFSRAFFNYINEAQVDSLSHNFITEGDRFIAIIAVEPDDAQKIKNWFNNLLSQ